MDFQYNQGMVVGMEKGILEAAKNAIIEGLPSEIIKKNT